MSSTIKIIKILLVVAIIVSIFPNLVFADSPPPPPPPPPCTIRSAGCYKEGNVKAGFGELSSTTFAYFLTESKCIRAGGCDCRGTPDDVKEETNPDDSNGACNCIAGAGWNAKAKCCGDDESDCGRISTGVLCSIDANREAASWISSSQSLGDIRYVGCDGTESLSDGTTWHKCDGQFWKRTISGNEYICIGRGRESIVECCGDGSCKSRIDGKRLSTGHSVSPANQQNEASTINLASNPVGLCTLLNIDDNPECGLESTNPACVCIPSSTKKESFQECVDVPDTTINQGGFSGESAGGVVAADSLITGAATECTTKYKCVSSQPIQCGGPPEILCPAGYFCKFDTNQITGNAVSSGYSKTYYCTPARKFVTDLDVDQLGVSTSDRQSTCGKAGFTWTGTKCCSEADDIGEYYNDADGVGGCWNKKPILSVNFVEGTDNSVVNFNGEFNGCAIERTNFNTNNDNLLDIIDTHNGQPLIENQNYCINDQEKNYYCSFQEKWLPTDGADKTHLSSAPIQNPKQEIECCAKDECWNGEQCVPNQKEDPLAQPTNGLRCIDGEWLPSDIRFTSDDLTSGFCPQKSQCLLNVFGKNASSQCIESGQYAADNYCENGQWSSRTKLLALKLLNLKSGDFILFCDDRQNALSNLQFLTESGEIVGNILSNLQTNNFCILKSQGKVIASTSINRNLEDIPRNTLNILGVEGCEEGLEDDGQYHACDATKKVWFNKRLKSFIYSSTSITSIPSEDVSFEEFIKNPIKGIIDSIKRLIKPPVDESYVKGIKKFDKLYITQQSGKSIRGSAEGKSFRNAVFQYSGFDADLCKTFEQFNQAKKQSNPFDASGISCKSEGNVHYVLVQGNKFSNIDPESIWPDLTSKLRIG